MLDLRTWSALPHVGGVVPLFERLRCSLHGCELCHNRCHAGCTVSTLPGSLHLCSCRAARLGSGAPALPVSRVLAGLRLVWWTLPGFPAQSARERRTATCASLSTKPAAGTGSCVKPQRRGRGVDSRDLDPALGNLPRPCASL